MHVLSVAIIFGPLIISSVITKVLWATVIKKIRHCVLSHFLSPFYSSKFFETMFYLFSKASRLNIMRKNIVILNIFIIIEILIVFNRKFIKIDCPSYSYKAVLHRVKSNIILLPSQMHFKSCNLKHSKLTVAYEASLDKILQLCYMRFQMKNFAISRLNNRKIYLFGY